MDKEEKERLGRYGQLVCDFANAETPVKACVRLFNGMQKTFHFWPDFAERAEEMFTISRLAKSMTKREIRLLKLIAHERRTRRLVKQKLRRAQKLPSKKSKREQSKEYLVAYDPERGSLAIVQGSSQQSPDLRGATNEGRREVLIDDLPEQSKKEAQSLLKTRKQILLIRKHLTQKRFSEIRNLVKRYEALLKGYNRIDDMRKAVKSLLNQAVEQKNLYYSETFGAFLRQYNSMQSFLHWLHPFHHELEVRKDGSINRVFRPKEHVFHSAKSNWATAYVKVLIYTTIQFLQCRDMRQKLHKCNECGKYYFAKRVYTSKSGLYFCRDKCRLDYHNREYIKSGKAKAAKRKGRKEGKYQ